VTTQAGRCPKCGCELVGGGDFVAWCRECGWNVDPSPPEPAGRLRSWWLDRQNRLALRLAGSLNGRDRIERGGRAVRLAVWLSAAGVHLVTVGLLVVAVVLMLSTWALGVRIVLGLFLLALFVVVQPFRRHSSLPEGTVVSRAEAPVLFDLIDRVSAAVGTTPVSRVIITAEYNASYLKDRRRRPIMAIGIPLWVVLSPQERVAVLGHELGHRVNGDLRDLAFVHYALATLTHWWHLFHSPGTPAWRQNVHARPTTQRGMVVLAEMLLPLVLFPITLLISALAGALELLAQRQGQRCEYIADQVSALAAGADAAATLTDKLLIAQTCVRELRQIVRFQRGTNPWQALAAYVASLPDTEWERLRRLARLRLHRIDTTHPPSALRHNFLKQLPPSHAAVVADAGRMQAINAELNAGATAAAAWLRSALAA
jgi:Zn-dependent protease with chaperone function